jgi:hypothetical protein
MMTTRRMYVANAHIRIAENLRAYSGYRFLLRLRIVKNGLFQRRFNL